MKAEQVFDYEGQRVVFRDKKQNVHSQPCHPRDIEIIEGPDNNKVKEAIAIDIRLGMGMSPVGVAKGLKFR